MKVYICFLTDEELFSDSYKSEIVDEVMYKVKTKFVLKTPEGAYISEDHPDANDTQNVRVNELVDKSGFLPQEMKKSEYKALFKKYYKTVSKKLKAAGRNDELKVFKKKGAEKMQGILKSFKEYEVYFTPGLDEGMVVLCKWEENGTVPTFYFWLHGCVAKSY